MKKLLLSSLALFCVATISAQVSYSETTKNDITSTGKGFIYQFNHLNSSLDKNTIMCTNGVPNHFDRFGVGNVQVSVDPSEDALVFSFDDYIGLGNSVRLSHCKFPSGNCGDVMTNGINLSDPAMAEIKVRMKSTVDMKFFIVASSNDNNQWVSHDDNFVVRTINAADGYTVFTFPIRATQWDGKGDLTKAIGWEFFLAKGQDVTKGSITFDWITFGDGYDELLMSTEEEINEDDVNVFPNPSSDKVTIEFDANTSTLVGMVDLMGKSVYSATVDEGNQQIQIDVSNLAKGIYFLNLQSENGRLTKKIIVE